MDQNDVKKQYEKETAKSWLVNPVCHGELGFASWDYQEWLENQYIKMYNEINKVVGMLK